MPLLLPEGRSRGPGLQGWLVRSCLLAAAAQGVCSLQGLGSFLGQEKGLGQLFFIRSMSNVNRNIIR